MFRPTVCKCGKLFLQKHYFSEKKFILDSKIDTGGMTCNFYVLDAFQDKNLKKIVLKENKPYCFK